MEKTEKQQVTVLLILANTVLAQTGEEFSNLEPISDKEFYSGVMLVGIAMLAFGLVVRLIGA